MSNLSEVSEPGLIPGINPPLLFNPCAISSVRTDEMAQGLKRSGGFIPGIKPGSETSERLDTILSRITFPGSLFLAGLSILPAIVYQFGVQQNWAMFYGGTSLIIMVGVAIDTIQQINSYLLNSHYDGLMKTGTSRKSLK